jgi:cation diffusion facilitator family transporter
LEQRALKLSIVGAAGMAFLGILFALLTRSQAIMLDGLFSLIGFAMGFATLKVARMVNQPDDQQFHFGYASFEPFVNLAKGLIITFLAIFALYSAVDALSHGGRPIASGYALLYAIVGAAGCFVIASIQRRTAAKTGSPLVEVDARSWLIDGLLTSAVCIAFLIVVLMERTEWVVYTPYADPVIVIGLVAFAAPLPFTIIRNNLRQLLLGAPEPEFQKKVRAKLESATKGLPIRRTVLRMVKVGRVLYLQVYLVVAESEKAVGLDDLDAVRESIAGEIGRAFPELAIDVVFTRDEKWAGPHGNLQG